MGHNKLNLRRIVGSGLALLILVILSGIAPLAKAEDDPAIIAFGQVTGYSGEEVCVPVTITGNPGLASFRFRVAYDAEKLTPVAVEQGTLLTEGAFFSNEEGNHTGTLTFLWYHTQDVQGDGELAVIRFLVAPTADGDYPLTVRYFPDDISNAALETVPHTVQDGSIHVEQRPTHIAIKPPDKLCYWEDERLDLTGMTVTAYYKDGTAKEVSDYTVSGFDAFPGEKEIVITVQGVSATFTVTVLEGTAPIPGDVNADGEVTDDDAEHLLNHTFFPSLYPVNQNCDFNGDSLVDSDDAVYLLNHTFFPERYPLK